jgi:hypothetical protein
MPGGRPLTRKKEAAIGALLCSGTIGRAAEVAGISERTLKNWLATPDFAAAYRAERLKLVEHASGLMQSACVSAVLCLMRNLSCGRPGSEIAAANSLLERSMAAVDLFDLQSRLEVLEQQAAQQGAVTHAFNGAAKDGEARNSGR